ncbi:hypothetical protein GW17_00006816 [Ensete ventricosum]|nr:hypothetical protein GW17_00006816 [Ensete ventricosum]RZS05867.1 hypothetical protein BHM03_00036426 [Ensete ventricosum]
MEVVGGRLGRLSTRYAPATVFSGPVRKWKKRWIPLSAPNSNAAANADGARSNLLLYKWAPVSSPANGAPQAEEPPPKKFRFVPVTDPLLSDGFLFRFQLYSLVPSQADLVRSISVIEEQKQEAAEKLDDENKPVEADPSLQPNQIDSSDSKPDMNNIAVEEAQVTICVSCHLFSASFVVIYIIHDWTDKLIKTDGK